LLEGRIALKAREARGGLAGFFGDSGSVAHGFGRTAGGTITTFDAPGAGTKIHQGTYSFAINTAGDITGWYLDSGSVFHGFVRKP
jgi:hypothetical protein